MINKIKEAKKLGYRFKLEENDTSYIAMFYKPSTADVPMEIQVSGDADAEKAVQAAFARIPVSDGVQEEKVPKLDAVREEETPTATEEQGAKASGSMDVKSPQRSTKRK